MNKLNLVSVGFIRIFTNITGRYANLIVVALQAICSNYVPQTIQNYSQEYTGKVYHQKGCQHFESCQHPLLWVWVECPKLREASSKRRRQKVIHVAKVQAKRVFFGAFTGSLGSCFIGGASTLMEHNARNHGTNSDFTS